MNEIQNSENSARLTRAIVLSVIAYFMWIAFFMPQQAPVQQPQETQQEGIVETQQPNTTAEQNPTTTQQEQPVVTDALPKSTSKNTPSFDSASLKSTISWETGGIQNVKLEDFYKATAVTGWWKWLFSGEGEWEPYLGGTEKFQVLTEKGSMLVAGFGDLQITEFNISKDKENAIVAKQTYKGVEITKRYSQDENNPYLFNIDVVFNNRTNQDIDDVWIAVVDEMEGDPGPYMDKLRPQMHVDGGVETFSDLEDLEERPDGYENEPLSWFGVGSRYFLAAIAEQNNAVFDRVYAAHFSDNMFGTVAYAQDVLGKNDKLVFSFTAYIGPKQLDVLSPLGDTWGDAVDFGIFGFFSRVLLFLLQVLYSGFGNWGVAIILATLLIRVILFPMTQKSYESSKKMQILSPKLKEIQEKYKDDKQKLSQEMMKLYRENGANPLGGCLPMLIQLPIWFALYSTLLYSVELYQSEFLFLKDLTEADPYGVLPVIYGFLMYANQKFMTPPDTASMGEQQRMMMKMMKYMTFVFTFFMFTFPSGLVLYFCCNSGLSIIQQRIIKRKFEKNPVVLDSQPQQAQ